MALLIGDRRQLLAKLFADCGLTKLLGWRSELATY